MGITVLPQPYFPTVGESLARLGPDLGRILYPNREDNRQKEERMRALREAFITNPGAISRTAAYARQNEGFAAQLGDFVGQNFAQMIKSTPEDLDEMLSVSAMEQVIELRRSDPEAYRRLAMEANGMGVATEDIVTTKTKQRFLEVWEEYIQNGRSPTDPADLAVLKKFGIDIEQPEIDTTSDVGSVSQLRAALIKAHRSDLIGEQGLIDYMRDPSTNPEITRVLNSIPADDTAEDIVSARGIYRDVIKVDPTITLPEVIQHVTNPDPASKVSRALDRIRVTGENEERRRIERQRAVDLGIAGTRIRSTINSTRGRNPISQEQARSLISDQINISINPLLKQMGDDLGIPGLHAEIPDLKRELFGIDWLRSDMDIPGITVVDGSGNEFDFNEIMNLGTIPGVGKGGGSSTPLSPQAQEAMSLLEGANMSPAAIARLRAQAPRVYQEFVQSGRITP